MDLLLLLVQVFLVVLLVVIPLFSGYDKFRKWPASRKLAALAIAGAISVVAFSQYRRLVTLDKGSLPDVLGGLGRARAPWYARSVVMTPWEYLGAVLAGAVLLALVFAAFQRRAYLAAAGWLLLFGATVTLMFLVKLGLWR